MIRLLIVDDSALMRRQLAQLFADDAEFEVQLARNGREAVEMNREFQPDVVTLDVNMPEMDGLTALSLMMNERATAVVMVSSLTEQGALATFEALNLGAVDFMAKPGGTISLSIDDIRDELRAKVRAASKARLRRPRLARGSLTAKLREERAQVEKRPMARSRVPGIDGLVLIGVSTGGPRTLEEILPYLPAEFPWPVVVAQHMPASFTRSFAERLDQRCALSVVEVSAPMNIEPGRIYFGRGGADMVVTNRAGRLGLMPKPESAQHLWHPSVELLGRSALEHVDPARVIGVMLTGMGYDGADAFAEIRRRGGRTIAESEETAIVFGMPAELIERGGATLTLRAERVAGQLKSWVGV